MLSTPTASLGTSYSTRTVRRLSCWQCRFSQRKRLQLTFLSLSLLPGCNEPFRPAAVALSWTPSVRGPQTATKPFGERNAASLLRVERSDPECHRRSLRARTWVHAHTERQKGRGEAFMEKRRTQRTKYKNTLIRFKRVKEKQVSMDFTFFKSESVIVKKCPCVY